MFNKIKPDKWRHFFAGIGMGAVLQGFMAFFLTDLALASFIVFIIVIAVSYGFELFSKITGLGHYDFIDAIASIVGGVLGMALVFFAQIMS